jgi:hypothetical protein
MDDFPIAFVTSRNEPPGLELLINFGVFAGREATPAEIDELAERLLAAIPNVSIISEQRHEVGHELEASIHQVRVELAREELPGEVEHESLERALVATAEEWARSCAAERHAEVTDL